MVQTVRWQGSHGGGVLVWIVAARPFRGAQRYGLVGPKMPMVGVPRAAAICIRPESLEMATLAAAIARMPLRRSVPVRSRTDGPPAATISAARGFSAGPPTTQ